MDNRRINGLRFCAFAAVVFLYGIPMHASAGVSPGEIAGRCTGWPSPHVELEWSAVPPLGSLPKSSNSILRSEDAGALRWFFGGPYPGVAGQRINGDATTPWSTDGYPAPNYAVYDLRDDAIQVGATYEYVAKYRPDTLSTNTYRVTINQSNCGNAGAPVVVLRAEPALIHAGEPVVLSWTSAGTTSCVADGSWSGMKPTSGSHIVQDIGQSSEFRLYCSDAQSRSGSATVRVFLDVAPPSDGMIAGSCTWNHTLSAPQVNLVWSRNPPPSQGVANSNSLQRGDAFPADISRYWDAIPHDALSYFFTDRNIQSNTQYQYRVKYRPDLATTNAYTIYVSPGTCGGPVETEGQLTISPRYQTVLPNVTAFLTAAGGGGGYEWELPSGAFTGSGSTVGVTYTNASLQPVTKTVTVRSGSEVATAQIQVAAVRTLQDDIVLTELSGAPSVTINNAAAQTSSLIVSVGLAHGFAGLADASVQVRMANTSGAVTTAPLKPFQSPMSWDLCEGLFACEDGLYTVYGVFRDAQGVESKIVLDSILYIRQPAGAPSVTIAGGAAVTTVRRVPLSLQHGFDETTLSSDEMLMQIANSAAGIDTAPVQFYTPSLPSWDLCEGLGSGCGAGVKTVHVRYCWRGICQPVVTDTIDYQGFACMPRPPCLDATPACSMPEPVDGWCSSPTPPPVAPGGVLINNGTLTTPSRLVTLVFRSPFGFGEDVSVRIVNEGGLSVRDRTIIESRGGGISSQPASGRISIADAIDPTTNKPLELESGTVRKLTSSLSGWDLCIERRTCVPGPYKVYAQYYRTPAQPGSRAVLGALGDEVSDIYYDTINYVLGTPLPPITPTPTALPTTPVVPSPSPVGGGAQPSPTLSPPTGIAGVVSGIIRAAPVVGSLSVASAIAVTASAVAALIPLLSPGAFGFAYQWLMGALGLLPKRKKTWGTVYDSATKRPIPFAQVQLLDRNKRVLEVRVADKEGRYGFLTTPESLMAQHLEVSIVARQAQYAFPSKAAPSIDGFVYNNIYFGNLIEVNDSTLINFDIPMDPLKPSHLPLLIESPSIALGASVAAVADAGFWLGLIMVPLNFVLMPNPLTFGVLCLFLGTASLRLFGISEHPFGVVKDSQSGRAMPFTLITLNDLTGKRVGFTVSDERGRYFLVVERGDYELNAFTSAAVQPSRRSQLLLRAKKGWITREITL